MSNGHNIKIALKLSPLKEILTLLLLLLLSLHYLVEIGPSAVGGSIIAKYESLFCLNGRQLYLWIIPFETVTINKYTGLTYQMYRLYENIMFYYMYLVGLLHMNESFIMYLIFICDRLRSHWKCIIQLLVIQYGLFVVWHKERMTTW